MNYTTVAGGAVLLWRKGWASPCATVVRGAVSAWCSGDEIVVQFRDGSSGIYKITRSGSSAYPIRMTR